MAAPSFNLPYNVSNVDIGSGYAQGLGQAGKSIAESLAGVTGIMQQSQAANDQIDMMTKLKDAQGNPILSQDDADALMSKGLGARQAFVGELMGRFHTNYSAQLEQQYKLQQIQAQVAAQGPQRAAEIAQTAEEQRKAIELTGAQQRQSQQAAAEEQAKLEAIKNPENRLMKPEQPAVVAPPNTKAADSVSSPLKLTLDAGKKNPNVLNLFPNLQR